mmetsp:Transcript_2156/g.4457  ORF Transcript_2156/g.4457 Transcript_2156/m.4457 type:complete len:202 (-) Transcript_2156:182-787(-)
MFPVCRRRRTINSSCDSWFLRGRNPSCMQFESLQCIMIKSLYSIPKLDHKFPTLHSEHKTVSIFRILLEKVFPLKNFLCRIRSCAGREWAEHQDKSLILQWKLFYQGGGHSRRMHSMFLYDFIPLQCFFKIMGLIAECDIEIFCSFNGKWRIQILETFNNLDCQHWSAANKHSPYLYGNGSGERTVPAQNRKVEINLVVHV